MGNRVIRHTTSRTSQDIWHCGLWTLHIPYSNTFSQMYSRGRDQYRGYFLSTPLNNMNMRRNGIATNTTAPLSLRISTLDVSVPITFFYGSGSYPSPSNC